MSVYNTHQRRDQLSQWAIAILSGDSFQGRQKNISDMPLKAIGGDAGFRQYYRVESPLRTLVAVDAPPETEDTHAFVRIARCWRAGGIRVPEVVAVNYEQGFMLQEDFGDVPLLSVLANNTLTKEKEAADHYQNALGILLDIQKQSAKHLPAYDKKLIQCELLLYIEWFLRELIGIDDYMENLETELSPLFMQLSDAMTQQPRGVIHRDYHSRNLMLQPDGAVGVIDFQGALCGPILYDVASLLNDCYIKWSEEQVYQWLMIFIKRHPVLANIDSKQLKTWFDMTSLQRHLKCLGVFSRLWFRDGKAGYLGEIPRTFDYVVSVCLRYPQFKKHGEWLESNVRPLLKDRLAEVVERVRV